MTYDQFTACPNDCQFLVRNGKEIGYCKRYKSFLQGNSGYPYAWRKGKCIFDESICPECGRKETYHKIEGRCTVHPETWVCDVCGWKQCFDNLLPERNSLGI